MTKFVAALSAGKVQLLDPGTLQIKNALTKSSSTSFAISESENLAISEGKKIRFFRFDLAIASFVPLNFGKSSEVILTEPCIKMS